VRRTRTSLPSWSSIDVREPSDSAAAAAEVLDVLGVRWALMGALAAAAYRRTPRLTTDADLLVEQAPGVAEAFVARGYEVRAAGDEPATPDMLLVRGNGARIDVLFATVDYLRGALDRAVDGVITAEDVIVQKLIAWRARDRDDVASIMEAGHRLDLDYIDRWAAEWGVADRWAQARARGS
jgi:hypothetical protein